MYRTYLETLDAVKLLRKVQKMLYVVGCVRCVGEWLTITMSMRDKQEENLEWNNSSYCRTRLTILMQCKAASNSWNEKRHNGGSTQTPFPWNLTTGC